MHDENAHAFGGVAAHAGLFGTAEDVARFATMMLNGGVFEHKRIVSCETLEKFTRRAGIVSPLASATPLARPLRTVTRATGASVRNTTPRALHSSAMAVVIEVGDR